MRPMFPSWIRSRKLIPRPMYFLAMLTTRRRLASVSRLRASVPCSMSRPMRLAELDRWRLDLPAPLHPPVDGVRGDARRLAWQVEGAHGRHGPGLGLRAGADPGVQVHEGSRRILDGQLAELNGLGQDDLF